MNTVQKNYADLVASMLQHISQEYSAEDWLMTDKATLEFFKEFAIKQKSQPSTKSQSASPKPPPPPLKSLKPTTPKPPPPPIKNLKPTTPKSPPPSSPLLNSMKPATPKPQSTIRNHQSVDFGDIQKIMGDKFGAQTIIDHVPDDANAKKINEKWKEGAKVEDVVIFSFNDHSKHHTFLENLTVAVKTCMRPATVISVHDIESEQDWEKLFSSPVLQLVIGSEVDINAHPNLKKHFFSKPHLLIDPIASYIQQPQRKASIWEKLYETLNNA